MIIPVFSTYLFIFCSFFSDTDIAIDTNYPTRTQSDLNETAPESIGNLPHTDSHLLDKKRKLIDPQKMEGIEFICMRILRDYLTLSMSNVLFNCERTIYNIFRITVVTENECLNGIRVTFEEYIAFERFFLMEVSF